MSQAEKEKLAQEVKDRYAMLRTVLMSLPFTHQRTAALATLETSETWAMKGLMVIEAE